MARDNKSLAFENKQGSQFMHKLKEPELRTTADAVFATPIGLQFYGQKTAHQTSCGSGKGLAQSNRGNPAPALE
jgi:hypothetical protein